MKWAISGGAGFLGLHLARRLVADGNDVRTLDVAPIADAVERDVTEIRGDMRDPAAAALPIRGSRREIMSVNVDGTATLLTAARDAGVRRVVYVSSTAVYGVPHVHPISEEFR